MNSERSFADVKIRLEEIVEEISQEGISLDDALALYEEAVKLGLDACDLSESDILPSEGNSGLQEIASIAGESPAVTSEEAAPYQEESSIEMPGEEDAG